MRRPSRTLPVAAVAATMLLAGCGDAGSPVVDGDGQDAPDDIDPGTGADPDDPTDEELDMPEGGDPEELVVGDAARRAGVDAADVTVVANEEVTWPDGSLGCPQPGQFYTQALVEGYRIVVEAGGEQWHYHGASGGPPAYCADPQDPAASGQDGTVDR